MLKIENNNSPTGAIVENQGMNIEGMYEGGVKALISNGNIYLSIGCTLVSMDLELHQHARKLSPMLFSKQEDQMSLMRETSTRYNNHVLFVMESYLYVINVDTAATTKLDPALINLIEIAYNKLTGKKPTEVLVTLCN